MTPQPEALRLAEILERPGYGWHTTPAQCAAELRRLAAEVESLRADAERYRWLKEGVCVDASYSDGVYLGAEVKTDVDYVQYTFHGAEVPSFDAAIDAARKG